MTATIAAFGNEKGGAGKTTTAVAVAHEVVARGGRALLVETDGQRNASQWLTGRDFNDWFDATLANVLDINLAPNMRASIPDATVPTSRAGLDVVPAASTRRMDEVNNSLNMRKSGTLALTRALRAVTEDYDYILIDCAPSTTALNINAYVAAIDGIVLVASPQQASHSGAISLISAIRDLNDEDYEDNLIESLGRPIPFAGIVVNNYDGRKRAHKEFRRDLGELADDLGRPLIGPPIPALSLMELVPPAGMGLDEVNDPRAEEIRVTLGHILDALAPATTTKGDDHA